MLTRRHEGHEGNRGHGSTSERPPPAKLVPAKAGSRGPLHTSNFDLQRMITRRHEATKKCNVLGPRMSRRWTTLKGLRLPARVSDPPSPVKSAGEAIILRVGSDPPPQESVIHFYRKGAMMAANAGGSVATHSLEMQGWVRRVGLEQRKLLVGQGANDWSQGLVTPPETQRGVMRQRGRVRPAR